MENLTGRYKKIPFIDTLVQQRRASTGGSGFILGVPGSGKSSLAMEQIHSILRDSSDAVVIIDTTGAYRPMAESLGGQIISMAPMLNAPEQSVHINPFDVCPSELESKYLPSKSDCICAWLEILQGTADFTFAQRAIIARCVEKIYQPYLFSKSRATGERDAALLPTLEGFCALLRDQDDCVAHLLAESLTPFVTGAYPSFSGASDTPHTGPLAVYDLSGLDGAICTSYVLLVLDHVCRRYVQPAMPPRSTHTWIFIDGIHALLCHRSSFRYVLSLFLSSPFYKFVCTGIMPSATNLPYPDAFPILFSGLRYCHLLNLSALDRWLFGQLFQIEKHIPWVENAPPGQGLCLLSIVLTAHDKNFTEQRLPTSSKTDYGISEYVPRFYFSPLPDIDAAMHLKAEVAKHIPGIAKTFPLRNKPS